MDLDASADGTLDAGDTTHPGAGPRQLVPTDPSLALLHAVAMALIGAPLEIEPILAEVTALTVPGLADLAIIYLLRDEHSLDRLAIVHRDPAKAELVRELQRRYPPDLSAPIGLAQVLRSGRPVMAADAQQHFASLMADDAQHALVQAIGPRSYITVALRTEGVILGALQLLITESDRQYTMNDLVVAEAIAARCALALRNARLHAALRDAHALALATAERTERLAQLVEALNATTTPEAVARAVTEQGARALGAGMAALALYAEDRQTLTMAHATGYPPELAAAWGTFPHDAPLPLADAARDGTPVWLPNLEARRERYPHLETLQASTGPGALACLPLVVEGSVVGVLGIGFGVDQPFDAELRALLLTLAHQCALALERARLYGAERDARQRAETALAQRDRFLTAAAHELRTPLTSLLGNAQLLRRRAAATSERPAREIQMLDALVGQAQRLNTLISNLLTVTEIDAEQLILARAPVDLCALARRVLAELEPFAERHTLVCEAPDEAMLTLGDEQRLHAMLEALLRNALIYSSAETAVTVRVRQVDATVELAVIDQGRGIPPEALPRIFERYYRASNALPSSGGGLGVNLWLVREMARRHGGDVTVESVEGKGSTFVVRLPHAAGSHPG